MSAEIKNPGVLRLCADELPWPDHVSHIRDVLGSGMPVEFSFTRSDVEPWFVLVKVGEAIHVQGSGGAHVGTFASIAAALVRGWERGGTC